MLRIFLEKGKMIRIKKGSMSLFIIFILFTGLQIKIVNVYSLNEKSWSRVVRLTSELYSWQPEVQKPAADIDSSSNLHILWSLKSNDVSFNIHALKYFEVDSKGDIIKQLLLTNRSSNSMSDIKLDQDDNVFLVGVEIDNNNVQDIMFIKLDNDGNIIKKRCLDVDLEKIDNVAIQIDERNNLHIIFRSGSTGNFMIKYVIINSDGEKISKIFDISNSMYCDSPNIHFIWTKEIEGVRVKSSYVSYCVVNEYGDMIYNEEKLTNDRTGWPNMAIDNFDDIHFVWTDWCSGRMEIYYAKFNKKDSELVDTERISRSASGSWLPTILIDNDNLWICMILKIQ